MTLQELLVKVEAAEGGSRELDAEIFVALGERSIWSNVEGGRMLVFKYRSKWTERDEVSVVYDYTGTRKPSHGMPSVKWEDLPRYTTSLDAAVALVEAKVPPHPAAIDQDRSDISLRFGSWGADATIDRDTFHGERKFYGFARTPALALIAAMLKALAAQEQPQ